MPLCPAADETLAERHSEAGGCCLAYVPGPRRRRPEIRATKGPGIKFHIQNHNQSDFFAAGELSVRRWNPRRATVSIFSHHVLLSVTLWMARLRKSSIRTLSERAPTRDNWALLDLELDISESRGESFQCHQPLTSSRSGFPFKEEEEKKYPSYYFNVKEGKRSCSWRS